MRPPVPAPRHRPPADHMLRCLPHGPSPSAPPPRRGRLSIVTKLAPPRSLCHETTGEVVHAAATPSGFLVRLDSRLPARTRHGRPLEGAVDGGPRDGEHLREVGDRVFAAARPGSQLLPWVTVAGAGVVIRRAVASCRHRAAMRSARRSAAAATCAGVDVRAAGRRRPLRHHAPTAINSVTAIATADRYPAYTVAVSTGFPLERISQITPAADPATTTPASSASTSRHDSFTGRFSSPAQHLANTGTGGHAGASHASNGLIAHTGLPVIIPAHHLLARARMTRNRQQFPGRDHAALTGDRSSPLCGGTA